MENILEILIQQLESEKLSLNDIEDEYWEHHKIKAKIMGEMDSSPKYNNYLQIDKILFDTNHEVTKMIETVHTM